jgi:hypothetical protein
MVESAQNRYRSQGRVMNRGPAMVAAAFCVAAALQFTGNAQAYDILDRVPPPPPRSAGNPWLESLRLEGAGYNTGTRDTKVPARASAR